MIRLTGVEIRRLVARRLAVFGVLGVLVVTALMLFGTWRNAQPLPLADQQLNRAHFEQAHADWVKNHEKYEQECRTGYASAPDPKPSVEEMCAMPEPRIEDWGKPTVSFVQEMPNLLLAGSYLLAAAAFLIGASFVGAEFSSGAIGNWLTFEPRRLRVYGSKVLGVALAAIPVAVVMLALLTAGTYLIVAELGVTTGLTGKVWGDLAEMGGRAVLLAAGAAALGAVVGVLLRHTAAAIGLAMGYIVLVEGVFGGFLEKAQPWLVRLNVDAWVKHDTTYYVNECRTDSRGQYLCDSLEKVLTFEHGAWYLGIVAVVLVALGAVVFSRRDVN